MRYFVWFVFMIAASSCVWENAQDLYGIPDCPQEEVSFRQTVLPVIQTNCAVSGCHVPGQQRPALQTYAQIAANAEKIMIRTSNGTMPPSASGKSLTQDQIDAIACWVESGAPDN